MKSRVRTFELINLNAYWLGLSFMWNSLHVLVLPAILLQFVPDERKNTLLGLMTFVGLIVAMVVQPLSGALSDRLMSRFGRRRPWIALGTIADLLFLGLMTMAGGIPLLTVGYVGLQLTSNVAHGPAQGLMHDRVHSEQMGIASGVKNVFDMAGLVISSLLIGRIMTPGRAEPAFLAIAGFLLLGAVFTILGVRETASPGHKSQRETPMPQTEASMKGLRDHPTFRRLIVSRLLFLTGVYGVQAFAQYFIRDTLAVADPVKLTGDLLATIVLTLIGFSVVAGYLCDRIGRKPMHVAAALLVAVGSCLMISAQSPSGILGFGSIIGAGIGVFISANWALANDMAPRGQAGKFLGLTNLATAGAGALSRLAGPGIDALNALRPDSYLGYDGLFLMAAILAVISVAVMTRIPEVRGRSSAALS